METTSAAQPTCPTVSLTKDAHASWCLGNGVAALRGAYTRTPDHTVQRTS